MKIYELKTEPNVPHHYIVSIGIKPMTSNSYGQLFLKYRPFYFNNTHIEKFRDVLLRTQDKLFKTTQLQALKIYNLDIIAQEFNSFKMASMVNDCTLHHFSCEFKLDRPEKVFAEFVKIANRDQKTKDIIFNARIY